MNEVPSSLQPISLLLGVESIATEMFSSPNLEELLKTFLVRLGESLDVSRIIIYHLHNNQEGNILVEAISPNIQSIKNQVFPIAYLGIGSLQNYTCDRVISLSDVTQITETLTIHQLWQTTGVKSMMTAPILFDSSTADSKIWGLAVVQQCDYLRQWQSFESEFLFEISQVLGQCLQSWELRLQSPTSSPTEQYPSDTLIERDREEFLAKRIDLTQDLEIISSQINPITEEIAVSSNFTLSDDETNETLDRIHSRENEDSINQAINIALQKFNLNIQHNSNQYSSDFVQTDDLQAIDDFDVDSITLEDVLEDFAQDKTQNKVDYLQQRISELIESLQQKIDEVAVLQSHIQELTESQKKFRQMLLDLQSEDLNHKIKDTVIEMYRSLSSEQ
ncbi:MAG: hypothetical protein DCF19_23145 [Pseudanabaena frigida]|uniref:Phytochrome chromophore attachment site domain-containing protein n=1 Tax=Pseudanabaena frigida TaxID=945775 RepID=A0A2W4VWR5_9CYAN|nr:MAG: hypothetical protein DCF19_23145 [Pseudanabaena frigida]